MLKGMKLLLSNWSFGIKSENKDLVPKNIYFSHNNNNYNNHFLSLNQSTLFAIQDYLQNTIDKINIRNFIKIQNLFKIYMYIYIYIYI